MAFEVHPLPADGPLELGDGASSGFMDFTAQLGPQPEHLPGMFVALVKHGDGCDPPGGRDPGVQLRVAGALVEPVPGGPSVAITDGGTQLGTAKLTRVPADGSRDVYRLKLLWTADSPPPQRWELQIVNHDDAERSFTWVVASSEDEKTGWKQPWIELQDVPAITARTLDVVPFTATVLNRGTGDLSITPPADPHLSSEFEFVAPPDPVPPNGCGKIELRFTAPATAVSSQAVYTADSNDPGRGAPGHRGSLTLEATTASPDVQVAVLAIDDLGQVGAYRRSIAAGHLSSAISAAVEPLRRLGTLVFGVDDSATTPPAAMQDLAAELTGRFPDTGVFTVVSYITLDGDSGVAPAAILEARRRALQTASSSAGSLSSPAAACIAVPAAVLDVARARGVAETEIMIVEVIPPPVVDDVDWNDDEPPMSFNIFGSNLILQPGDTPDIVFDAQPLHPEGLGDTGESGNCPIFGHVTPTQITAIMPRFQREMSVDVTVSRPDGAESTGNIRFTAVL